MSLPTPIVQYLNTKYIHHYKISYSYTYEAILRRFKI